MATPRILLLEYLESLDERPEFTELAEVFPDPLSLKSMFNYELSAFGGNFKVRGIGHNRREAKQEAAKKMLIELAKDREEVKKLLETNNFDSMIEKSYSVDPEKNVLQKLNGLF